MSRDDRDKHLITRGNVDGIASAAVFLSRYPSSKISFVTSPRAGANALVKDRSSREIFLVDIALTRDVVEAVGHRKAQTVYLLDHHPSSMTEGMSGIRIVQEGMSAAHVLYDHLRAGTHLKRLVSIADHLEYCETDLLKDTLRKHGRQRLEEEARILDFSWRLNIEDDEFRLVASKHLSEGHWPSQVGAVKRRYIQVLNENRWGKAVARVKAGLEVREGVGIFQCNEKNRSLYGFGTRALVDVAQRRGCSYAMMLNDRKDNCSVSIRGMSDRGLDIGRFVEEFVTLHGMDGGGHPNSAGARIPLPMENRFVDEFVSASLIR
ncbi:MAG: DHH family phosphoesterase [Methanomassiliicoccales archaeon]|nr:MAG: DHH family phosphoesterase [Methanomassiliicoccales archaeon]